MLIGVGIVVAFIGGIYLVCEFRVESCLNWWRRRPANRKRFISQRIQDARLQVRRIYREAERQMDEAAGRKHEFHFGGWSDW